MTRAELLVCALVVLLVVVPVACALHNPVNVDPNYPPAPPLGLELGDAEAGG